MGQLTNYKGEEMLSVMSEESKAMVKKNTAALREDEILMLAYYLEYATTYVRQTSQLANKIKEEAPTKDYKKN